MSVSSSLPFSSIRTVDGRKWATKALHPPAAIGQKDLVGLPDRDCQSSLPMETRKTYVISALESSEKDSLWDLTILSTNVAGAPYVYWVCKTGETPFFDDARVQYDPSYMLLSSSGAITGQRIIYKSVSCRLDAAAIGDQGFIVSAQQHSVDMAASTGQKLFDSAKVPQPMDANAGYLVASVAYLGANSAGGTGPVFVPSHASIQQLSPMSYMGRARDGAYVVHKFSKANINYKPIIAGMMGYAMGPVSTDPTQYALQGQNAFMPVQTGFGPSDLDCAWIKFTGLSRSATVDVTVVVGLEVIPSMTSPLSAVTRGVVPPDESAIDYVIGQYAVTPDCRPVSANDFGEVIHTLIGPAAAGLSAIFPEAAPFIGPAASALSALFGSSSKKSSKSRASKPKPQQKPKPKRQPKNINRAMARMTVSPRSRVVPSAPPAPLSYNNGTLTYNQLPRFSRRAVPRNTQFVRHPRNPFLARSRRGGESFYVPL
jgi:hypothetical protein